MKFSVIPVSLAMAAAVISCGGGSYSYSGQLWCTFESTSDVQNVYGADSLYCSQTFVQGDMLAFFSSADSDGSNFKGGFMLSLMKDTVYTAGHFTERSIYCSAADSTGAYNSKGFAVFHDSGSGMPEHSVSFTYMDMGSCSLNRIMVTNTNYIVNTVKFGSDVCPAFEKDDYLRFTITGWLNGAETGTASYTLAKYDGNGLSVATGWKQMDVSNIGRFDYLDFSLESNRGDLPLYCCIDEMSASVSIASE